jgi:hypothetical protein
MWTLSDGFRRRESLNPRDPVNRPDGITRPDLSTGLPANRLISRIQLTEPAY